MDVNITIKVPDYVLLILIEAGLSDNEIAEAFKEFIQWSLNSRTVSETEADFLDWWDEEKEFYGLSED